MAINYGGVNPRDQRFFEMGLNKDELYGDPGNWTPGTVIAPENRDAAFRQAQNFFGDIRRNSPDIKNLPGFLTDPNTQPDDPRLRQYYPVDPATGTVNFPQGYQRPWIDDDLTWQDMVGSALKIGGVAAGMGAFAPWGLPGLPGTENLPGVGKGLGSVTGAGAPVSQITLPGQVPLSGVPISGAALPGVNAATAATTFPASLPTAPSGVPIPPGVPTQTGGPGLGDVIKGGAGAVAGGLMNKVKKAWDDASLGDLVNIGTGLYSTIKGAEQGDAVAEGSRQQAELAREMFEYEKGIRQGDIDYYTNLRDNPNDFMSSPRFMGALDAYNRSLSVQGNPANNPTLSNQAIAFGLGTYGNALNNSATRAGLGNASTIANLGQQYGNTLFNAAGLSNMGDANVARGLGFGSSLFNTNPFFGRA